MTRRDAVILLAGAAGGWPRPGLAGRIADLGYVEGKNILIEFRWAEGQYDQLPVLAAELVRLTVDVIVTHAKRATTTIPIVVTAVADMLALGLVSSLSRPGGHVTGLTFFNPELAAKRPPPPLPRCLAPVPMTSAPRPARCSHGGAVGTVSERTGLKQESHYK